MSGGGSRLIAATARHLGSATPLISFPRTGGGDWKIWSRFLAVGGANVYDIGNICGTCEFWFRRLPAPADPLDLDEIRERVDGGLDAADGAVVESFGRLLERGAYRIALFRLQPVRVAPGSADDYFSCEQPSSWGRRIGDEVTDPQTPYYRVRRESGLTDPWGKDRTFEFLVPLQPEDRLDSRRIDAVEARLASGARPTAVAVGILDNKQYYDSESGHWCLAHYLMDGHHKVAAAARCGKPITLLSFIATERGIAAPESLDAFLERYPRGE
ncbi:MAG TPA: hypothetical protein VGW40_09450 [Allosphingosinicella sp.]|nr:hypothetical protein [Allosphingosinicella sp.]